MNDGPTHWLYPTRPGSGYVLSDEGPDEEAPLVTPTAIWAALRRQRDGHPVWNWNLSSGYRLMQPGDAVWVYAGIPHQFLCALAQAVEIFDEDGMWTVALNWDVAGTEALESAPIRRAEFGQVPQGVCRADARTRAVLDAWLDKQDIGFSSPEDPDGPLSDRDARTRVLRQIAERRGQVTFRRQLLAAYDGQCAVTGESAVQVLEAAHIRPYRGEQTNVVRNGLLLRSDIHTLFDLDLLGIDPQGCVVISPTLRDTSYASLHGKQATLPAATKSRPSKRLLAERLRRLATGSTVPDR